MHILLTCVCKAGHSILIFFWIQAGHIFLWFPVAGLWAVRVCLLNVFSLAAAGDNVVLRFTSRSLQMLRNELTSDIKQCCGHVTTRNCGSNNNVENHTIMIILYVSSCMYYLYVLHLLLSWSWVADQAFLSLVSLFSSFF